DWSSDVCSSDLSLLAALLARGGKRRGRKVVALENPTRAVQTVEAADPHRGLVHILTFVLACSFGTNTPGMVRFVIDDEQVVRGGHLPQDLARVGFVALRAALVHAAALLELRLALPG